MERKKANFSVSPAKTESCKSIGPRDYLAPVQQHLTKSICDQAFAEVRDKERQRKWTLHTLVWFWIGLLIGPYTSQTRALLEARSGNPLLPKIDASPESFFMKIQKVRPAFFQRLFQSFTASIYSQFKADFAADLPASCSAFKTVLAVDGSRLAKVGRLLKATRKITKAIIPGSMQALYDLRKGHLIDLWFDPNGHASELAMWEKVKPSLQRGSLLLADRYYAKPCVWRALEDVGIFMITRHNGTVKYETLKKLSRCRNSKCSMDETLVRMGGSAGSEPVLLRMVHIWGSGFDTVLLTNILDKDIMPALDVASIYRRRWSIERMYLAMKDVLDLNCLFNCTPAAVGQQVYATAILYNALRLAQSKIAIHADILPASLSEQRLFPVLTENFIKATYMQAGVILYHSKMSKEHPALADDDPLEGLDFDHPTLRIRPLEFLVEERSPERRKRRFCKGRRGHTAFGKMPGTKKYLEN